MSKKLFAFLLCLGVLASLCACGSNNQQEEASTQPPTESFTREESPSYEQTSEKQDEIITEQIVHLPETTIPAPVPTPTPEITQAPTQASQETTTKVYEKTGEMAYSHDPSNKFIQAVATKYSVDATYLCVLYTVPENDSNIVLQFDGTLNADGTPKRNKDTLIAIYSIDSALNSKRASEDSSLNEYSYGEMKVMFITTKKHIMPEFEELK